MKHVIEIFFHKSIISLNSIPHKIFKSSTKGWRYTSISIPGPFGPGISKDNKRLDCFMHIHGGRLYGIKITGHMLYELLIEPKKLKSSEASPSLILRGSEEKFGYFSSKLYMTMNQQDVITLHHQLVHPYAISFILRFLLS